MIEELQFPKELLAVEKELKTLPHLERERFLPSRRIDLLCFRKDQETFKPLLLMEFKESLLTHDAFDQMMAYNHYVAAPYVALVNGEEIRFRYHGGQLGSLPTFTQLIQGL